ncbi:GyrI-like domain-containing protein [Pseudomonas knackmussii]|uniref:GyrI-like domain-containing protein n=1 Tax=Pseudomonas knackmussii TaxID=65741 RepID=UPI003F4A1943
MKHRILELPAFDLVGMEFKPASDGSIRALWQRFLPQAPQLANRTDAQVLYGLCTHDERGEFRYIAGAQVAPAEVPDGMLQISVPAQKYAVFVHRGTVDEMPDSFQRIYSELLALRGLEPRQAPAFERYDEHFHGPDDPTSEVELYIPVY